MVSPSTIFLENKKKTVLWTQNVSENRATGSENYPIYCYVTFISYQDFRRFLFQ